jgi:hypothetical protein
VSTAHTGNNNTRVEKFVLANDASPFRVKMVENINFKDNNPHLTTFASEITHLQTNPGEDHFGLRWTGAFCPPEDGLYDFVLPGVDDYFELHIGNHISNSFTQIMTQAHPMAVQPFISQFYMQAGKMYPFIAIFVETSGEDFLTLKWRLPSSGPQSPAVAIPPSAFCTGWSFFNNSVLTIYSPFAMVPGVEVTFTIPSLSNPLCPRPNATVSQRHSFLCHLVPAEYPPHELELGWQQHSVLILWIISRQDCAIIVTGNNYGQNWGFKSSQHELYIARAACAPLRRHGYSLWTIVFFFWPKCRVLLACWLRCHCISEPVASCSHRSGAKFWRC